MKLPNGESAIIEMSKLQDYCLSPTHFRGRNKARVFQSVLGLTLDDAFGLHALLKSAARDEDAIEGTSDLYGNRYIIDFALSWKGNSAKVRSCWMIPAGEVLPRFITCYIL